MSRYRSAIARLRLSPLSPVVSFPLVWALGVLLGQIHLLRSQQNWPAEVWLVLLLVPIAFVGGAVYGKRLAGRVRSGWVGWKVDAAARTDERLVRRILIGCTAIGWAELIHQFVAAGAVPLLSSDIDVARFDLPGGPTVILTNLLAIAVIVALVRPQRLLSRDAKFELGIVAVCLAGYALQGGRGSLLLPLAVSLIGRWTYWGRPRLPVAGWLVLAVAAIVAVSGIFFLRTSQEVDTFQAELYAKTLPGVPEPLYPLVPVDLAYATNFQTLAAVVEHFPDEAGWGYGAYDGEGFDLVLGSSAKDLSATTRLINPPWTTATMAGSLWADGGFIGVALGSSLIGLIAGLGYWLYRRTRQFRFALLASYVLYLALFGVYTNLWTSQPDWVLIVPGLFFAGTFVQRGMPVGARSWERAPGAAAPRLWPPSRSAVVAVIGALGTVALAGVVLAPALPPGGVPARVVGRLPGVPGTPIGPIAAATDAGAAGPNSTLYRLERGLSGQPLLRADGIGPQPLRDAVRIAGKAGAGAGYDVYTRPGDLDPSLYEFKSRGRKRISYTVSNANYGERLGSGRFDVPKRDGRQRRLFVAHWRGSEPDLFIVDADGKSRPTVEIRSGESGFRKQIARRHVNSPLLDPSIWQVDVFDAFRARAGQPHRADLVMANDTGSLDNAEVHVLSGESRFKRFVQQRVMAIHADDAAGLSFHAGLSRGAPSLLNFAPPPSNSASPVRAVQMFGAR